MIDSFKNFERLRYRLANDMKEIASDTKEISSDAKGQISNTIFATIFSAFITEIAFNTTEKNYNFYFIAFQIFIFCLAYIASYALYNFLFTKISIQIQKRKVNKIDTSALAMKQIQKDFDNIACDSILLAKGYVTAFKQLKKTKKNKSLLTFYFYEITHYLDTACDKTKELVKYKPECIRTSQTSTGVDIFRVINLKNMMYEIKQFLDDEFEYICKNDVHKSEISYQHTQIENKINYIINNL